MATATGFLCVTRNVAFPLSEKRLKTGYRISYDKADLIISTCKERRHFNRLEFF